MSDTRKPDHLDADAWAKEKGIVPSSPGSDDPEVDVVAKVDNVDSAPELGDSPGKEVNRPDNIFEFVREFYTVRAVVGDKYREHFKDLNDNLSGEQQEELFRIANETDTEFTKTLSLAEFLLETPGKVNQRDQIMSFVQRVASNAGSLTITDSNAVFQEWLDGNSAASNKLDLFFDRIERITDGKDKKGNLKKLAQKPRNNLGCIAAIWLFYKDEATLTQLISHLMKSGMNLQGQSGRLVESRAFAFVASMIKSTNKKKFAYFLDYVGRSELKLNEQCKSEAARNIELAKRAAYLNADLESIRTDLEKSERELTEQHDKYAALLSAKSELDKKLQHASIHHGADLESADSQFSTVLKELLDTLELAKTAFSRGPEKAHILEYQLEEIEQIIRKELK